MRDQGKLSILVNRKDYKLLLTATLLCQPYEGFVKRARQQDQDHRYRLEFTVRQLKSFVKYLDFEKSWFEYGPRRTGARGYHCAAAGIVADHVADEKIHEPDVIIFKHAPQPESGER